MRQETFLRNSLQAVRCIYVLFVLCYTACDVVFVTLQSTTGPRAAGCAPWRVRRMRHVDRSLAGSATGAMETPGLVGDLFSSKSRFCSSAAYASVGRGWS
jgi:hypothetical protein